MAEPVNSDLDGGSVAATVENVGGIDSCSVSFEHGVTILTGRNATNRTSFLKSVAGALGGSAAALKSDTDSGSVRLEIGDETYTRTYARDGPTVRVGGEPYTDSTDVVDLFACLLGDNPARRAVERGDDLREVIMRPVDKDRIEQEIRELERERDEVDRRLAEIERERERLPRLEERREELDAEIEETQAEIESLERALDEFEADEAEAERAEELVGELTALQTERNRLRTNVDAQESTLVELRDRRADAQAALGDTTVENDELDSVKRERSRLRERRRALSDTVNDLAAIVDFNEDVIAGANDVLGADGDDPTAALDPSSESIECWTCGSVVEHGDVADRLDELRAVVEEKRDERKAVEAELAELETRYDELRSAVDRRAALEREVDEMAREIERCEERIERLEADAERVRQDISDLEERVEETEQLRESGLVEKHSRLSDLQYELGQLEAERDDVAESLETLRGLVDERDQLRGQRDQLNEELVRLRSRIDDLEREAVDQFNDRMSEVLDLLEYGNIARVWIERRAGNRRGQDGVFELHIVRENEGGAMYEDVVENLSESEREVVGFVVALAGSLVHDINEHVPILLLDSLEAIDSDRIAALVEYFADYVPYLLVALLPEDERALPDEYDRLSAEALSS